MARKKYLLYWFEDIFLFGSQWCRLNLSYFAVTIEFNPFNQWRCQVNATWNIPYLSSREKFLIFALRKYSIFIFPSWGNSSYICSEEIIHIFPLRKYFLSLLWANIPNLSSGENFISVLWGNISYLCSEEIFQIFALRKYFNASRSDWIQSSVRRWCGVKYSETLARQNLR